MTDKDALTTGVLAAVHNPERLAALRHVGLLDTPAEQAFDRLSRLAARLLGVPIALISLVDEQRLFFKSCVGLPEPWASRRQAPLSHSLCPYVVATAAPVILADGRTHPILKESLTLRELGLVAYAGIPLATAEGHVLGTLCVIDRQPRQWTVEEIELLHDLAATVMTTINLHRAGIERQAEEGVRRDSEERFRLLFEHSPDAILLCDPHATDVFWPIVDCNAAACCMNGYTHEELLGQSIQLLHPAEDDPGRRAAFLAALRGTGTIRTEAVHRRKDGTCFPIEFSASLIRLDGRELILSIDRDITERKRAEAALQESEARFRILFEHSPDAIWLLDPHAPDDSWPIVDCNPAACRIHGYTRDELLGQSITCFAVDPMHADPRPPDFEQRWRATQVGREDLHRRKDGTLLSIEYSTTVITLGGRELVLSIERDITARKRTEQRLREVNQELSQRVAELSALNEIARAVTEWTELPAALQAIGSTLVWLFDRAAISLWLIDDRQTRLTCLATSAADETTLGGPTVMLAEDPVAAEVIARGVGVVLAADARLPRVAQTTDPAGESCSGGCLLLPLQARGTVIGLLCIRAAAPGSSYAPAHMTLAQTIAGTLATAIENTRLLAQAQEAAAQEERRRLARELHDSVSQSLFLANLNADVLPQLWAHDPSAAERALGDLQQFTRTALAEMRMLLLELRPQALVRTPLNELLQTLGAAIGAKHGVVVAVDLQPAPPLPADVQVALYRIAQEACNNIVKHAQATQVTIMLQVAPAYRGGENQAWCGDVALRIADDGRGFEPAAARAGRLGLSTMRERAAGIGATVAITSRPGAGTQVAVAWHGSAADSTEDP